MNSVQFKDQNTDNSCQHHDATILEMRAKAAVPNTRTKLLVDVSRDRGFKARSPSWFTWSFSGIFSHKMSFRESDTSWVRFHIYKHGMRHKFERIVLFWWYSGVQLSFSSERPFAHPQRNL
jgi:hypothetical protein